MSLIKEPDVNHQTILQVAQQMMVAARTAPKAKGIDNLKMVIADGNELMVIAQKMRDMALEFNLPSFERDAGNIEKSDVLFLVGCEIMTIGLKKCGLCGFPDCTAKSRFSKVPCVFNAGDLGIAVGSAVSVAMDHRIDNRIMYSAGLAAIELKWLGEEVKIAYGIPLSVSSKSPFFDRPIH